MKIELNNINKSFGNNVVLRSVNMKIENGKIQGLMGENGAGKSTLMNILTGNIEMDKGTIKIDGKVLTRKELNRRKDITFLHQEISVFDHLTVLDNLFLKQEETKLKFILDKKIMKKKAENVLKELNLNIDLKKTVSQCSMSEKQLIAIARSLLSGSKIIVMDEPTAAISDRESKSLLKLIIEQKKKGIGFVYISHRLEEMKQICDDITVIRDGKSIFTKPMITTSVQDVIKAMVGRDIKSLYPKKISPKKENILEVKNLKYKGEFKNINFNVRNGEILGIYGLVGAGRTQVLESIFGLRKNVEGEIKLKNKIYSPIHPKQAIDNGVAMVSEDRKNTGLLLNQSIGDNIIISNLKLISKKTIINNSNVNNYVESLYKKLKVKSESSSVICGSLSGGNQQKVVIAKWLGLAPWVILLDEPTRGVDIGSREEIYDIINKLSLANVSIIMVSSDLPEVIGLSHRVMVMHEGEQLKILDNFPKDLTQEKIMQVITTNEGVKNE